MCLTDAVHPEHSRGTVSSEARMPRRRSAQSLDFAREERKGVLHSNAVSIRAQGERCGEEAYPFTLLASKVPRPGLNVLSSMNCLRGFLATLRCTARSCAVLPVRGSDIPARYRRSCRAPCDASSIWLRARHDCPSFCKQHFGDFRARVAFSLHRQARLQLTRPHVLRPWLAGDDFHPSSHDTWHCGNWHQFLPMILEAPPPGRMPQLISERPNCASSAANGYVAGEQRTICRRRSTSR
jgi:hypothetical protein